MKKQYYGVDIAEKRKTLLKSKVAEKYIKAIIAEADTSIKETSNAFKMSDYMRFFENGNRKIFEKSYFCRRNKCFSIFVAYWLTENEKYLIPLIDYIGYICDEFTWCLPAHYNFPTVPSVDAVERVDLFQAETARFFSEIVMCIGDKLPDYILDRMRTEIYRRIFAGLEKVEHYFWEDCKMNWATVCGAGCFMAALYFGNDEEKEKYLSRFIHCLDSYLEGIEDDGCCQEGVVYWSYGFAHFMILAEAVKVYTDGKIDYFANPKVRELALFPQRVRMSHSKVASFSDGGEEFKFKIGVLSFLKSIYSNVRLPELDYGSYGGNVNSVWEFLWFDDNYTAEKSDIGYHYFKNAMWYINKFDNYSFAAKGGSNSEPHNHNDLGSFMITVGEETVISDLGCGEYVKETFNLKTRYNFIQNSSRGHSVPIINDEYQCAGKDYTAKNPIAHENSFELDIEDAYREGIVNRIHRCFILDESSVTLKDSFEYSDETKTVTERIISKIRPIISEGCVDFGLAKIEFDSKRYSVSLSVDSFTAHNGVDIVDVYMTDFALKNTAETEFELKILIDKAVCSLCH